MNMDCRGIVDFFRKEPIIVHIARQQSASRRQRGYRYNTYTIHARRKDICEYWRCSSLVAMSTSRRGRRGALWL